MLLIAHQLGHSASAVTTSVTIADGLDYDAGMHKLDYRAVDSRLYYQAHNTMADYVVEQQ